MLRTILLTVVISFVVVSCNKGSDSFSMLQGQSVFKQSAVYTQQKIDILWVVDNSASMASSQSNVAANFESFIQKFRGKNYDFRMAVTTSDAYLATLKNLPNQLRFSDGTDATTHSGVHVITPTTANIENVFITNIMQGTSGYGDERAFQSFRDSLQSSLNYDFLRPDAFLAIIILSDEDDFSHDTLTYANHDYNWNGLHTIDSYVSFLDELKPAIAGNRSYSVNAITILDSACLSILTDEWPDRIMGKRYVELVNATGGAKASLCSNFGDSLKLISDSIVSLTSQFILDRIPYVETLHIIVNGVEIPNDSAHGWTYNDVQNSITFHGDSIPMDDADIQINFEPKSIKY